MNRKTLQKCIDELDRDMPRLDYIRGILETLIESLPANEIVQGSAGSSGTFGVIKKIPTGNAMADEASILESEAAARMSHIDKSAIKTQ